MSVNASTPPGPLRMAFGLSGNLDAMRAADQASAQCATALDGQSPDLACIFFTADHVPHAAAITALVRRRLGAGMIIGCSAEAVLGGETELEGAPGVSVLAGVMPGVRFRPFHTGTMPQPVGGQMPDVDAMRDAAGMGEPEYRGTILLADPFSVPINLVLPALSAARPAPRDDLSARAPIVGGMASASPKPGGNALVLNGDVVRGGCIGVSLCGQVRIDSLVSQGCRPFGPTLVITGAKGQIVTGLGGRKALEVLHEAIMELPEETREQLRRGVFIGRVVNEYKDRFGRGDFLIRAVVGADQENGAIAVGDLMRVGQTVRFHMRDATTAHEDLALLLDAQALHGPPAGVLLCTCNGRGTKLFEKPSHDAAAICRAFAPEIAGEERAKGGQLLEQRSAVGGAGGAVARHTTVPLAGFFAAGEIGPVGDEAFLHGHTASLAVFRQA